MSIDTSVGRVDGVRVSIDTSVQVSGQGSGRKTIGGPPLADFFHFYAHFSRAAASRHAPRKRRFMCQRCGAS